MVASTATSASTHLEKTSADQLIAVHSFIDDLGIFSIFAYFTASSFFRKPSFSSVYSLAALHTNLLPPSAGHFVSRFFFLWISIGFAIYWQLIKQIAIHLIALHPRHAIERNSSRGLHCCALWLLPPPPLPDFSGSVSCLLLLFIFPLLYCIRQDYQ